MKLKDDQLRVQELLKETVTLLCKNGLNYKARFSVDALIGVTIDDGEVFLVNIRESVGSEPETSDSEQDSGKKSENAVKAKKRPPDDGHSGVSPSKRSRSANDQDDEYDENDYDDDESNISSAHVKEEPGDDDLVFVKQEHSDFMTTSTPNAFDSQSFHSQNSQPVFSHNRTANMSDPSLINVSQDASWTMNQSASSIDPANLANMSMTQSTSQGGSNQNAVMRLEWASADFTAKPMATPNQHRRKKITSTEGAAFKQSDGKKIFVCPVCARVYRSISKFRFHMRAMHQDGKPVACQTCGRADFRCESNFYKHIKQCRKASGIGDSRSDESFSNTGDETLDQSQSSLSNILML